MPHTDLKLPDTSLCKLLAMLFSDIPDVLDAIAMFRRQNIGNF